MTPRPAVLAALLAIAGAVQAQSPSPDPAAPRLARVAELQRRSEAAIARHDFAAAEKGFRAILAEREAVLPKDHPEIGAAHYQLAELLTLDRRHDLAAPHFAAAHDLARRIYPAGHAERRALHRRRAANALARKDWKQAAELYRPFVKAGYKPGGPEAERQAWAEAARGVALSLGELGRPAEAADVWKPLLALQEREFGPDEPALVATLDPYAAALKAAGRAEEAKAIADRSQRLRANKGP